MTSTQDVNEEEPHPLYIPSTDYAGSYLSRLSHPDGGTLTPDDIQLLQHVNCSYLSSGKPPTLLALKQHAHSLVNLIRKFTLEFSHGPIDGKGDHSNGQFDENDGFDWLNNLDEPYDNDDELHHVPLWALVNQVENEIQLPDKNVIEHHCPLKKARDFGPLARKDATRRPYKDHHNLAMHANECLEILDHEYSATGGLLSLLPGEFDEDTEDMAAARNTLLGQWLLHHQHLVGRMHELEINYANALDVLAGEAHVPLQMLQRWGPDGMAKGRTIAYPQDRFVLANAGDDVFDHLHRLMDKAEAQIEQKEKIWRQSGVSGERIWQKSRGGEWYSRGLVPVDLLTRFYRIKEKGGQSTIFVLPAIEQHPGVAHTRRMESRPTVVSVVTPTWPERVSEWEMKFKEQLDRARETELVKQALLRDKIEMQDAMAVKNAELRKNRRDLAFYEKTLGRGEKERQDGLFEKIAAYRHKLVQLKAVLPEEYHKHLDLTEPRGEGE